MDHARIASRIRQNVESVCANLSGFKVELLLRANMDIRALLSSITRRPRPAVESNQASGAPVGPFFHLSFPSRKPWWETIDRGQMLDIMRHARKGLEHTISAWRACSKLYGRVLQLGRPPKHWNAFVSKLLRATRRIHGSAKSAASSGQIWRPG